jgi:predicted acylesterase/phospholipase RssA
VDGSAPAEGEMQKGVGGRVGAGDGLAFAEVEGENEAGGRGQGGNSRCAVVVVVIGRSGGISWWLGDRGTFQVTTAHTACLGSFAPVYSGRISTLFKEESGLATHHNEDRLYIGIQHLDWARHLREEVIQDLAACVKPMEFPVGQVVIALDSEIKHTYFVVAGRLEGTLFDRLGKVVHRDTFQRGSIVALISVLLPERSHVHVEAVEHTTVLQLSLDDLLRLTARYPEFQLAVLGSAARMVKRLVMVDRERPKPAAVGVVHHADASRPLAIAIARRLRQLGESPCVAGDDERWQPEEGIPHRLLFENRELIGPERIKQLLSEWSSHNRVMIDVRADHSIDDLDRLASYADVLLWCIQPQDAAAAVQTLKAVERSVPRLCEKVRLVWILKPETPAPPYVPELQELAARDFKVHSGELQPGQGKLLHQGVERIARHLRGVQIGLALGGGAARGMAHLGVLKALGQHGIYVDMLAGTSAGAMVGTLYAAGLDPEYLTQCFKKDLQPPWWLRRLPGGGYWYLLHKYRWGRFEPMLRKYLGHLRMEQLAIPATTIAVDLVDGVVLARDVGDATHNILDSINLPPLSVPIVKTEQAVVDGGLLNNVPANTLVAKGCNFVIASTVTAKLEKDFLGIRSKKSRGVSKFVTTIQVMMRQSMIQSYSMNAVGVEPADFVISPDVTSFDLSEFTRADEMAVIGEAATHASIHQLKGMLAKLDPNLFA